jgi:hypothetical protein
MFKFDKLKRVHLEITNRCQASCPMCPRNIHSGIENPLIDNSDWTLSQFKKIFTVEVLEQLDSVQFCGSFGDPVINNDLVEMCKHAAPYTSIEINTNGGARSKQWWRDLAAVLPKHHQVEFALDGFAGVHELYRIGTSFDKVVENAKEFIDAGGNASWLFIRFKHNEHQVEDARKLASEMGFFKFELKDTRRFVVDKFPVLNKTGKVSHYLEPPSNNNIPIVNLTSINNYKEWKTATNISCFALDNKEIYIDSKMRMFPCCIIAAFTDTLYDTKLYKENKLPGFEIQNQVGAKVKQDVYNLINELGGDDKINALNYGIKNIIENTQWQTIWHDKWASNKSMCCTAMCSASSPFIKLSEQFQDA